MDEKKRNPIKAVIASSKVKVMRVESLVLDL